MTRIVIYTMVVVMFVASVFYVFEMMNVDHDYAIPCPSYVNELVEKEAGPYQAPLGVLGIRFEKIDLTCAVIYSAPKKI